MFLVIKINENKNKNLSLVGDCQTILLLTFGELHYIENYLILFRSSFQSYLYVLHVCPSLSNPLRCSLERKYTVHFIIYIALDLPSCYFPLLLYGLTSTMVHEGVFI